MSVEKLKQAGWIAKIDLETGVKAVYESIKAMEF
jgi:hypothetical protein